MLSAHHDWIEPVLQQFDNQHTDETRLQEAAAQLVRLRNNLNQQVQRLENQN